MSMSTLLCTPPNIEARANALFCKRLLLFFSRACVTLFLLSTPFQTHASEDTRVFLWEQANTQASVAHTPEEFLTAANTYNRLVAEGIYNGPIFINLGSVLVMAGDGVNAEAAFSRAERYLGVTPETSHGLIAALALKTGRTRGDLPWSRTAFFWHYTLPCSFRALVTLSGWSLFWLGLFCKILIRKKNTPSPLKSLAEAFQLTGVLVTLIFGASTLMTLVHERHDKITWEARVFSTAPSLEGDS